MSIKNRGMRVLGTSLSSLALVQLTLGSAFAATAPNVVNADKYKTQSPIKHVIVIIGENHSFDNVFATYEPRDGRRIWNLRSLGIVNKDGTPGPNFHLAQQKAATDTAADSFLLSPQKTVFPGNVLPAPLVG